MTHDNLSALRGEYPTLPLDVWAHRTAARDVVGDVGMGVESPEVLARIEAGLPTSPDDTYCRVTPRFEAPAGPHEWLNHTVFVGKGERRGDHSVFDYYIVT